MHVEYKVIGRLYIKYNKTILIMLFGGECLEFVVFIAFIICQVEVMCKIRWKKKCQNADLFFFFF